MADFVSTSSPPVNLHWTTNSTADFTRQEKSGKFYIQCWTSSYYTTRINKMHFFMHSVFRKMKATFIWAEMNQGTLNINTFLCLSSALCLLFYGLGPPIWE